MKIFIFLIILTFLFNLGYSSSTTIHSLNNNQYELVPKVINFTSYDVNIKLKTKSNDNVVFEKKIPKNTSSFLPHQSATTDHMSRYYLISAGNPLQIGDTIEISLSSFMDFFSFSCFNCSNNLLYKGNILHSMNNAEPPKYFAEFTRNQANSPMRDVTIETTYRLGDDILKKIYFLIYIKPIPKEDTKIIVKEEVNNTYTAKIQFDNGEPPVLCCIIQ